MNTIMSPSEKKLPPRGYMEAAAKKIRNAYGLPGSGRKKCEATAMNFLVFSDSTVLQNSEAQGILIGLLAEVVDAGRWDVLFTVLLDRMRESDPVWGQHPIARILYMSPSHGKEFKEKILDKLPRDKRAKLEEYRYDVCSQFGPRVTEYGIFVGELMSTT